MENLPAASLKHQLSSDESIKLAECEAIITNGMVTFVEVGTALLTISDKRLYRQTHSTFDEYVKDRWQMTARRAYQLCAAAEVIKEVRFENVNHGSQITNERQIRALAKAPKEQRPRILEAIVATGHPLTAESIAAAVKGTPPPAQIPSPRKHGKREQAEWWFLNASVHDRGKFLTALISADCDIVVASKAALRSRFDEWFKQRVTETDATI